MMCISYTILIIFTDISKLCSITINNNYIQILPFILPDTNKSSAGDKLKLNASNNPGSIQLISLLLLLLLLVLLLLFSS